MPAFPTLVPQTLVIRLFSLLLFTLYVSAVPLAATKTRPSYHITPEKKWMNDPQRPFFLGDEWHLYYLYNSNFDSSNPGSGGTEWYHITSTNMVHWTRRGVAIEKYKPNPPSGIILGDIETGSAVVDTNNTAGFGRNAVVAIVTQMADGVQQQSLFYSTNNGYSFIPYEGNPVMPNPSPNSKPAFRDPKIIWDSKAGHWVMSLAEGSKIGFYTSIDLKTWAYISEFKPENAGVDLGILECPDLYQIDLDGDSTKRTWILALGANGYRYNRTTGTAYWTGNWDGNGFTATNSFPQWMDDGPDFYATVSWENPNDRYGSRYAIGWMNNWDYAASLPYYADFAGQDSLVREVKLKTINSSPTLVSIPIGGYEDIVASSKSVSEKTITTDPASASLPSDLEEGAYIIRATISKNDGDKGNEVRFLIKSDGTFSTTVGYDFLHSQAFLVRDSDGSATDSMAAGPKQAYDTVRTAPYPSGGSTVKLVIYVDWNSVEVFVNDGVAVLSGLIYPNQGANGVRVVSDTGSLTLVSFSYAACESIY
ncbi:glycosyl hydrolase [Fusarium sp. MPI-SDFR-AT-0072]|nr:glycosyl hydrolase [Fusarium sp. MPI-SDFR-AT-0072]